MRQYEPTIEKEMKKFYGTLSERDKRRYAAVEAIKLGHGGQKYVAKVLGCSEKTISRGAKELQEMPTESEPAQRIRRKGGGRHKYEKKDKIDAQFLDVLENYTAGDPMREGVRWTNLRPKEIGVYLQEKHGVKVSKFVIRRLLKKHGYRRRKAQKKQTMKQVNNRDEQFQNIARLRQEYKQAGNPIISMDTKKKEHLGNFYRDGHLYTRETILTNDHDFPSYGEGVVIPHALYDQQQNHGYIHLGTSKDTSQFACDSIRLWWLQHGLLLYPQATSILILCDGGGSNNSRHFIFKQELQNLVNELGIEIRMAHYPPYCSKYNPIEHRLFPHVTRACQGVVFKSVDLVKQLRPSVKIHDSV